MTTQTATLPPASSRPVRVMHNPLVRWDGDPCDLPRISIVTACLNHADYLEATLQSILGQGYPNLEYVVMDGGSTDGSLDIIARHEDYLTHWESRPDDGQYHAIQRGFELTTGELMLWLNADDMLHRNALWTIVDMFRQLPQVEWVIGMPTEYDVFGRAMATTARNRWSRLGYLRGDHGTIQQESVVWRRSLWERAGGCLDTSYNLAADVELWMRFFRHAPLYTALTFIGGFRKVPGQRSRRHRDVYQAEVERIMQREPLTAGDAAALARSRRFDRLWLRLPLSRRSWRVQRTYERLFEYPPVITYNAERRAFELREDECP